MKLHFYKEIEELIIALAEVIKDASQKAISARGQFNFVLSGGGSPKGLYKLLASEPYKSQIDWSKIYFFFGDERFVPENDDQRNSLMAKEFLFNPLNITDSHIFSVDTSASPEEAAQYYSKVIASHFNHKPVHFDFILLGLGDNAHTASLFPFTAVLKNTEANIKAVFIKELDMYRITMNAPMINQSRQVAFLVFGKDKADAVYHVLEDDKGSSEKYPAKLISPKNGNLNWYLDEKASGLLDQTAKY